jgi:sensor histidine kinase YesM
MVDFNYIMEDNSRSGELITAINKEIDVFDIYVHSLDPANDIEWQDAVRETKNTFAKVPLDYGRLRDERYAQLFSLKTAYDEYCKARDQVISDYQSDTMYVSQLYNVYAMQSYMVQYAEKFIDTTTREGNKRYRELMPIVVSVPFLVAAIGLIIFLMIYYISRMMNRSITVPVMKLASASRKIAANDYNIDDVVVDNKDEIGDLVSAFNKMKFATGEYIRALEDKREALDQLHAQELENLEIEKQLETMNLELLKSQINPHFLFNTLNVIAGTANLEDAHTTEQMIEALSSLFRYNLKNQAKETLLSQELKISRDYMYLQKMRFGSRLVYTKNIASDLDTTSITVPAFLLQPVVENSIVHGIAHIEEGGRIELRAYKKDDALYISVMDTGAGMPKDKVDALNAKSISVTQEHAGIGLFNVQKRICSLYTGSEVTVESIENKGTTVTICIRS